jgi:hypothetical protein
MKDVMRLAVRTSVLSSLLAITAIACNKGAEAKPDTTAVAAATPAQPASSADSAITIRGTVVSATATEVVLKSDTGNVTVNVTQPFHVYTRAPSTLSKVTASSFIGVTTVKQADGSERATGIHVFPEELRGLGEGSRMMAPDTTATARRMTNGNVASSQMTNGTATPKRMSNGNVSSTNGSTLGVDYAGGSQTVTVPPKTPVTEFKLAKSGLVAGQQVAVLVKRAADGSLTADKALSMAK